MAASAPPPFTTGSDVETARVEALGERIDLQGRGLRQHAARGTIINSGFRVGLAGLGLLQRVVIAVFLTASEFGVWALILTTLLTIGWLKDVGVTDKYVQQSEPDQEAAFQKAFTLELLLSLAFFALLAAVLPLYALAYGRPEIIVPGIVLATAVPISAFESPIWIAYRRMQFVRQRVLTAVDPVLAAIVTIVLGVAGAGYWSLVIGVVAGSVAGAVAATVTSPYKPKLRFDREATREYASFSWPLFGLQLSNLVVVQGAVLLSARFIGIAGVGAIALASSISVFAERVDGIVSETIYPAVCAVADRMDLVYEAFVKTNRLAMMWGMAFGIGLALFAGDLVRFVLGDQWHSYVWLLAAVGAMAGCRQIGFNWQIFMRAANRTRPMFYSGLINVVSFFAIVAPCIMTLGLTGYAVGTGAALAIQLIARGYFLRQIFPAFRLLPYVVRAVVPSLIAAGIVLLVRHWIGGAHRSLPRALAELALFSAITIACTWRIERPLISEMLGYLRGEGGGLRTRGQEAAPQLP